MDVYKTISTTHIIIIEIIIMLGESVVFHRTIPTNHVTRLKSSSMTNGKIEQSAGNLKYDFFSVTSFLLLLTQDSGLHGVLFDDGKDDTPHNVSVNVILIFLEVLLLPRPCWYGIVNIFELVVC